MGTHVLSKKGQDKGGQRFLKVLYESRLWSAWLCAVLNGWERRPCDSGGQQDSMMSDSVSTERGHRMGTVFDILITLNILLSCLWQMVSGRHARTFLGLSGPNRMRGAAPQAKSKHILHYIVLSGAKRFQGIKFQIQLKSDNWSDFIKHLLLL